MRSDAERGWLFSDEKQRLEQLVRKRFNLPASAKIDLRKAAAYLAYLDTPKARVEDILDEIDAERDRG